MNVISYDSSEMSAYFFGAVATVTQMRMTASLIRSIQWQQKKSLREKSFFVCSLTSSLSSYFISHTEITQGSEIIWSLHNKITATKMTWWKQLGCACRGNFRFHFPNFLPLCFFYIGKEKYWKVKRIHMMMMERASRKNYKPSNYLRMHSSSLNSFSCLLL